MDLSKTRSGLSTQTKIQIRSEYIGIIPDLEIHSSLNQSRPQVRKSTQEWIKSTLR